MSNRSVLILEPENYAPEAIGIYTALGEVLFWDGHSSHEKIDTVVAKLAYSIDKKFLLKFPQLKYVITTTTGTNHIDVETCHSRGVQVLSLKDEASKEFLNSIHSTSQLTFGLIISSVRKLHQAASSVENGDWDRNKHRGRNLESLKLGIVGLGRIGKKVADYAHAFGMEVHSHDPFIDSSKFPQVTFHKHLHDLMKSVDVLSLHVPLNAQTTRMITKKNLKFLKDGSFLINTSRGEVVNEEDLLSELLAQRLSAAVDVLTDELSIENSILMKHVNNLPNLTITPHIGGATTDSMNATEVHMAQRWSHEVAP